MTRKSTSPKTAGASAPLPALDTSVWKAVPVKIGHLEGAHLCLMGTGGTGSCASKVSRPR
jgi:hypothetical protein